MSQPLKSLKDVFLAALDAEPAQRAALLDDLSAGDAAFRRQVEALLRAHEQPDSLLDSPRIDLGLGDDPPDPNGNPTLSPPITEGPGTQVGPYKLLQQIGEGGMGVVYMAEQTEPVERRVALKIIKPGMDSRQVIGRFEAERHALSMMDHPNIARVLDAGTTETGRPYFVMELVKGVPITQYCDEHQLTPRQRLELFVPVCHAVQHAHQKGIIHRDIKPSNVLVAEYDDRPVPKIIDFGVAKAIDQRLTEQTVFTQLGQVVGTIDYMSPEQAKLNELDVDTRSDIYSLGVLLYELLTGETPFDRQRLRAAAFDELLRIIREEEPPRPSLRLSSSGSLPSIAANRQTEGKRLSTLVRGELDWIVMKALEKDRARRYETANALADDVEHYLQDEPVVACPPSAAYRFKKFARRNKGFLAPMLVVGAILIVASFVSTSQAIRATRALRSEMVARQEAEEAHGEANRARVQAEKGRDRARAAEGVAQQQRDRARAAEQLAEANFAKARAAVEEYLTQVTESELLSVPGLQPLRRDLLTAARNYYEDFVDQRGDQLDLQLDLAAAHYRLGLIQRELGESEAAEQSEARAIELLETLRGRGEDTPAVKTQLAEVFYAAGQREATIQLCQELLASGPDNVEVRALLGKAYNRLAITEHDAGRLDAALEWYQKAFEVRQELARRFPDEPNYLGQFAATVNNLGVLLSSQGRDHEALEMYLEALEYSQHVHELKPSSVQFGELLATMLENVATSQARLGLEEEGLATYERLVAIRRKLVWENPAVAGLRGDLSQAWQLLGRLQQKLGRTSESRESFRAARDILENIPRGTPEQLFELAAVYSRLARPPETGAEAPGEEELAEMQRNAGLAVETLRKAIDAGYRDLQALKTSHDLDALRERDDLRGLIATLEKIVKTESPAQQGPRTDPESLDGRQRTSGLEMPSRLSSMWSEDPARATALPDEPIPKLPRGLDYQQTLGGSLHSIGPGQMKPGEYDDAEHALRQALELRENVQARQPSSAQAAVDVCEVKARLAQLYWDYHRWPSAHRLWQEVLTDLHRVAVGHPEDEAIQRAAASLDREICARYGAMGLWDLAATAARHNAALKRVTNYTDDADSAVVLAVAEGQGAARDYFEELVRQLREQHPADPPSAQQIRTNTLLSPAVIDAEECIARGTKLLEDDPNRYFHQFCLALAQYRGARYAEALKTIESNPVNASWDQTPAESNQPGCAYLCALAVQADGRHEDALAQLKRAEGLYQATCKLQLVGGRTKLTEPLCRWFWNLAAAQLLRQEAWQGIEGQAPPVGPWWHLIQARGYALLGESRRAAKEYDAAVVAAPDDAEVWTTRARILQQLGDIAQAEADCSRALELAPEDPRGWIQRAICYTQRGDREKADGDLARAASLEPKPGTAIDLAELRSTLGKLYWDDGRMVDAHRLWLEALGELRQAAVDNPESQSVQQRVLLFTREIWRHLGVDTIATLTQSNGWGLLFDGKSLEGWTAAKGEEFGGQVKVADGAIVLERGGRYTGIVSTRILPLINYEIAYEIWSQGPVNYEEKVVRPGDFVASLIFPCGETCGRWYAGTDFTQLGNQPAIRAPVRHVWFVARQWLDLNLRVTSEWIDASLEGRELFHVKTDEMNENWEDWLSGASTGFLLFTAGPPIRVRNIRIRAIEPAAEQPQQPGGPEGAASRKSTIQGQ